MTKYSLRALDVDAAIPEIKRQIAKPSYANVVKWGLSLVIKDLEDGKACQKQNIHRQIGWAECSCGLMVESNSGESFDTVSERLFRSKGHIDHSKGQLTILFVRKWKLPQSSSSLYCWWCLQCGYLGEVALGENRKVGRAPAHTCETDLLKQRLLSQLTKSLVKPGTRPVVAGASSWNAAIEKAISLISD